MSALLEVATWVATGIGVAVLTLTGILLLAVAAGRFIGHGDETPTPTPTPTPLHDPIQDDLNHRLHVEYVRDWMPDADVVHELRELDEAMERWVTRGRHPSTQRREGQ
jgi:hypothetical protein